MNLDAEEHNDERDWESDEDDSDSDNDSEEGDSDSEEEDEGGEDFEEDFEAYDDESFKVKFSPKLQMWNERDFDWDNPHDRSLGYIPEKMTDLFISGDIDPNDEKYSKLLHLLQKDPRLWSTLYISGPGSIQETSSPAFLTILKAAFMKAEALHLDGCMHDSFAFECLNAGLMLPNAIKDLELWNHQHRPMKREEAELFSQGLAAATSIETLTLPGGLTMEGVGAALVRGFQRNQTLLTLRLIWCSFEDGCLDDLLLALQNHPKLKKLQLRSPDPISQGTMDVLSEWLGKEDCKLEFLELWHDRADSGRLPHFSERFFNKPNTSLKQLELARTGIDSWTVLGSLFTSLVSLKVNETYISDLGPVGSYLTQNLPNLISLDLSQNNISDLSPLDSLLLGNSTTLQELILNHNRIGVPAIQSFASKLPQMNTLRSLSLVCNAFATLEIGVNALVDALEGNRSLENLELFRHCVMFPVNFDITDIKSKINTATCFNRGARRLLNKLNALPKPVPVHLISLALERASHLGHYAEKDIWGSPRGRSVRAAIVYSMLQENDILFKYHGNHY